MQGDCRASASVQPAAALTISALDVARCTEGSRASVWESVLRKNLRTGDLGRIIAAIELAEAGGAEPQVLEDAHVQFEQLAEQALTSAAQRESIEEVQQVLQHLERLQGCADLAAHAHRKLYALCDLSLEAAMATGSASAVINAIEVSRGTLQETSLLVRSAEAWLLADKLSYAPSFASQSTGLSPNVSGESESTHSPAELRDVSDISSRSCWHEKNAQCRRIDTEPSDLSADSERAWSDFSAVTVVGPCNGSAPNPQVFGRSSSSDPDLEAGTSLSISRTTAQSRQRTRQGPAALRKPPPSSECALQ